MLASVTFHRPKRNPKMTITTRNAGMISVAAMSFAVLASSEGASALAQDVSAPITATATATAAVSPTNTSDIQFVANPVVQTASEEAVAEDKAANEAAKAKAEAEAAAAEEAAKMSATHPNAGSLSAMVSKMPTGASLNSQMNCLASAVYFESRGEPLAGQLAVAKVIMNRAASRQFPNSYCSVVKQRSQFSFVRGGRIPTPNKGSNAWRRAKAIAMIADQNLWRSAAKDSLYFHATYVRPSWARKKSQRARINTHIFYR